MANTPVDFESSPTIVNELEDMTYLRNRRQRSAHTGDIEPHGSDSSAG